MYITKYSTNEHYSISAITIANVKECLEIITGGGGVFEKTI